MTADKTTDSPLAEKGHVEIYSSVPNTDKDPASEYVQPKGDYSGAAKKTDPVEIKLVRKLDMRILVSW